MSAQPLDDRDQALRTEFQFMAGGLIAVGIASLLAVPVMTPSKMTSAALFCFAVSVPSLSTFVLILRCHIILPRADEYDDSLKSPLLSFPFKRPWWILMFGPIGFSSGIVGLWLLIFDFWWVCGVAFIVLATAGYVACCAHIGYLLDMEMAAAMQQRMRERKAAILRKAGHYDPATDPERSQLSVDPGLRKLREEAYGYAIFPTMASGAALMQGEVHHGGRMVGWAYVTHAIPPAQYDDQLFIELVLFHDKEAFDRFKKDELTLSSDVAPIVMTAGAADNARYSQGVLVFVEPKRRQNNVAKTTEITVEGQITVEGRTFIFKPILPWWRQVLGRRRRADDLVDRQTRVFQQWRRSTYGGQQKRAGPTDSPTAVDDARVDE